MPPNPVPSQDVLDYIKRLERRLDELERRTLRNVVIPEGGLTIRSGGELNVLHPSGNWILRVAKGSDGKYYLSVHRDDGTAALEIGTSTMGDQFLALWDRTGHIVVSDDADSGQGLARPWLSIPTTNVAAASLPTTASAAFFSVVSSGWFQKQQPFIEAQALLLSNASGAGEARYTLNGTQVGEAIPITAGAFAWTSLQRFPIPGNVGDYVRLELQLRLTNATGGVAGSMIATQRQS